MGALLRLALVGDGVHGGGDGFLVAEVIALDGLEVGVEFVDERDAGGDVEFQDLLLGEVVEMFDEGSEGVAVRGDDDALAGLHSGRDFFVPEREEAVDGVLEALGERELILGDAGVAGIVAGPALVGFFQSRWRDVVAAAPNEDLVVAEFRSGLAFVEALERAVVAFVQAPVFFHGNPKLVEFGEDAPEGVERTLEDGDIGDVEREAFLLEEFAGGLGLGAAFVAELDIVPAGEAVFFIPGAFAVADENEFVHGCIEIERGA